MSTALGALPLEDWKLLISQVHPARLQLLLLSLGPWAPVAFLVAYTIRPLFLIPSGIFAVTAGLAFGIGWGTVYTVAGATSGACLAFLLARRLGKEWVMRRLGGSLEDIHQLAGAHGFRLVLLFRLIPVLPFDVVNYGAGLTDMSFRSFLCATVLGITPATVAFAYFGESLGTLQVQDLVWALVLLVILIGVPIVGRQYLRQAGGK